MKMIFRPPNFNCQVSPKDQPNKKKIWVPCCAQDENEAISLLDAIGFVTHQVQPYDFEATWRVEAIAELKRAAAVIQPLVAAGKKPVYEAKKDQHPPDYEFKDTLWSELKIHLILLFHKKCAYCEKDFTDVRDVHVEHYRPKGKVQGDPHHPGYWWLAYEPRNYLPSCSACNSYFKANWFPLLEGSQRPLTLTADLQNEPEPFAVLYQDLQTEQPVIINPYEEDPSDYIDFMPSFTLENTGGGLAVQNVKLPGVAIPKDPGGRGNKMILLFGLNRDLLVNKRRQIQFGVFQRFATAFFNKDRQAKDRLICEILEGRQEYFTAAKAEICAYCAEMGIPSPF